MHLLFELECMLMRELQVHKRKPPGTKRITEANPLAFQPVAIDQAFLDNYRNPALPYTKAGDFIFLAMAETKFRRLKGHTDMPRLVAALDAHQRSLQIDKEESRLDHSRPRSRHARSFSSERDIPQRVARSG